MLVLAILTEIMQVYCCSVPDKLKPKTWKRRTLYTANIYHPAIVKLQPKADKVKEKIYDLMIKGI